MTHLPQVDIYTDGACSGNPGVGGWGAVILRSKGERQIYGGVKHTTNNQMELMAAIEALKILKKPCAVNLYTDSRYVVDGITKWIWNWKHNDWRTKSKKPIANLELWQELDEICSSSLVKFHWVQGHAGNYHNEIADKLARHGLNETRSNNVNIVKRLRGN